MSPSPKPLVRKRAIAAAKSVVKIEMVAQMAGVSASTVSRILNGTAVVSAAKKLAVDAAIAHLGFVPNPMARSLAGGRSLSVGIITQAVDSPFYGMAMRGIEVQLDAAGYSPLFVSGHWHADEEARCIETLRARRVDGIIVLTGRLSDAALRTCAKTLPVVVTGRTLKAPNLASLNFDNFEGALLATQHLLDLGHRDIAFITGDLAHPDANERLRGYHVAHELAGLEVNPLLVVPGTFLEDSGLAAVERLLEIGQGFSAIFGANDQMALGASLALHRRKIRVPQDVSVVGFDDLPLSRFATPPLTTVHYPANELGQMAAAAMLQMLRGEKPLTAVPVPRLVVRESAQRFAPERRS